MIQFKRTATKNITVHLKRIKKEYQVEWRIGCCVESLRAKKIVNDSPLFVLRELLQSTKIKDGKKELKLLEKAESGWNRSCGS
jgi:hypothetical protein